MHTRDCMEVIFRTAGLLVMLWGGWHLLDIPASIPDAILGNDDFSSTLSYGLQSLIYGIPGLLLGLALLLGGRYLAYWLIPLPPALPTSRN